MRPHLRTMYVLCAAWFLAGGMPSQTFPSGCNRQLVQQAQQARIPQPYAPRQNTQYCDGRVLVPSSGAFTLLAVVIRAPEPPQTSAPRIRLAVPTKLLPQLTRSQSLEVHGQELSTNGSWRLDGQMTSSGLDVDRRPAIDPMHINPDNLGFVAVLLPDARVHIPLVVGNATNGRVSLIVRAPSPLRLVRLEISDARAPYSAVVARNTKANEVIHILVPPVGKTGVKLVKLVAAAAGTDRYTLTRDILLPGSD